MKIIKSTDKQLKQFRSDYLKSLPEFQELHIELMLNNSDFYLLTVDNNKVGYVVKTKENVLIEFFVIDKYIPSSLIYFNQTITELSITTTYCKSFDSLLLSCCMLNSYPYSLIGVLYRDFYDRKIVRNPDIIMREADSNSIELILAQDDSIKELFETENQLRAFINTDKFFLFFMNTDLIGCGTILKTNKDWDYCDLGVWVNPKYRKKGMATQILTSLRSYAIDNKMKPTCGCAIDNIASQKALEKSGFISKHKLIEFRVN